MLLRREFERLYRFTCFQRRKLFVHRFIVSIRFILTFDLLFFLCEVIRAQKPIFIGSTP